MMNILIKSETIELHRKLFQGDVKVSDNLCKANQGFSRKETGRNRLARMFRSVQFFRWDSENGSGLRRGDVKEARQGVVGLCRASGIHYKREKKADTSVHCLLLRL
ncbi:hypothetical protein SQ11_12820 [Nitrosospira sp. NpAV]|nr:hypothetical protein SQ11_12820 [Nitrosospira sp. NpAV]